jgi:hypothetical protein
MTLCAQEMNNAVHTTGTAHLVHYLVNYMLVFLRSIVVFKMPKIQVTAVMEVNIHMIPAIHVLVFKHPLYQLLKPAKMDKFWLETAANAHLVNLSKVDTAKIIRCNPNKLNVSKINISHGKDSALVIQDKQSPTLVQDVLRATTASLANHLLIINAHAQLDNQL